MYEQALIENKLGPSYKRVVPGIIKTKKESNNATTATPVSTMPTTSTADNLKQSQDSATESWEFPKKTARVPKKKKAGWARCRPGQCYVLRNPSVNP